ncbi:MAG: M23 family metallopeptidase [Flavobacterium sp.]|jgi:murein DD-endopeptidase MepM/ murein hydrolase activator NlpD|uniref:M23 family metallopeptidase n=1 Tax=Flavobacterium sp. TaxID=239 RepID=UPI001B466753|nr:M23 family metallopeptidase [Flavobacterium sp.]MBP9849582.1 M23 family metallopeptidase [Flavobacterium sp.]TAF09925.1 MAG: M23 family metallopeptidase [Flavobacteriia bacterium]WRH74322.1 MAG: M23 family metallopeptidase [Flavobacterium sp.]
MSKVKYYYDSENLAYKRIRTKKRKKFAYVVLFLLSSALFGFLIFLLLINTSYFETPKDKIQAREIEALALNYKVLNKKIDLMNEVLEAIENRDNDIYRIYFNATPISEEERKAGFGGVNRYKDLQGYNNSELLENTTKRVDILTKELVIQSKSLDEIVALAKKKEKLLAAIPAIQPVKNEDLKHMASGYGYRSDPFTKIRKFHYGMDFTARTGTPIYATGDGVVYKADASLSGYGNHIEINHGYGYKTLYAHLSKYKCRPGQRVKRGDIIGYVGSTGRSQAPHLHYEVLKNGERVNPLNFYYGSISAKEYIEISKLANQENQSLD